MLDAEEAAERVLAAAAAGRQIGLLSDLDPDFGLARANATAVAVLRRREAAGERLAGHKLGFTNTTIWDEYGVGAPIWGPVYESTVEPIGEPVPLAGLLEPRIEPEIMFRFGSAPRPDMDDDELAATVSHVALGFEVVHSLFPGWKFRAADTVAAFALHGLLLTGPFRELTERTRGAWFERLASFRVTLLRNGEVADEGRAENVLGGGPPVAIRHLVDVVTAIEGAPAIRKNDVFTTGTLTRALPVSPGESWEARVDGLSLEPIRVALV